jgi:hypothetical protein
MRSPKFAVLLVAGALAAGGCGSGGPATTSGDTPRGASSPSTTVVAGGSTTSTTKPPDPCTRLTTAEIQVATGKTVTGSTAENSFSCSYTTSDAGTVTVGVASPVTSESFEDDLKASATGDTLPPPLSGLGDEAFQQNGGLQVRSGSTSVSVTIFGSGRYAPPDNPGAVALAKLIIGRL